MDYQAAATIIDRNSGLYDITTNEGRVRRRLFLSAQGNICEFAPRSRKRGYIIPQSTVANWLGMAKVEKPDTNIVEKFRRYASRATFPRLSCENASLQTRQRTVTRTGSQPALA